MVHLLLSLAFLGLMAFGIQSVWHDLTRPLVMQPWDDERVMVEQQLEAAPARATAATTAGAAPRPVPARAFHPAFTAPLAA